ncbi:SDR family oxidoreductase [Candidatus Dojkabacteria bacterium]|nr:SDR family oxidoreductase [Candidatus Dojkabacteria bacterium]
MKKVLITGGTSGLGLEIAKKLSRKKYHVTILGKDESKLENVKNDLRSKNISTIKCDLRNYQEIKRELKKVKDIDILINNAGIIAYEKIEKHDPGNIKEIIDVNLLGAIFVTKELIPLFKRKNSGIILNISSTSGLVTGGHAEECAYVASKFGVTGFTETLKKEMEEEGKNIRIFGFYPGGMNTPLFKKAGLKKDTSKFMDPAEIAEIVVFILERSDSINMDHVVVNRNKNL